MDHPFWTTFFQTEKTGRKTAEKKKTSNVSKERVIARLLWFFSLCSRDSGYPASCRLGCLGTERERGARGTVVGWLGRHARTTEGVLKIDSFRIHVPSLPSLKPWEDTYFLVLRFLWKKNYAKPSILTKMPRIISQFAGWTKYRRFLGGGVCESCRQVLRVLRLQWRNIPREESWRKVDVRDGFKGF